MNREQDTGRVPIQGRNEGCRVSNAAHTHGPLFLPFEGCIHGPQYPRIHCLPVKVYLKVSPVERYKTKNTFVCIFLLKCYMVFFW